MKIKEWIDYLFWKRKWFRMFLLFPVWLLPIGYFMSKHIDMQPDSKCRMLLMFLYIIPLSLALLDNDNVDSPKKPY